MAGDSPNSLLPPLSQAKMSSEQKEQGLRASGGHRKGSNAVGRVGFTSLWNMEVRRLGLIESGVSAGHAPKVTQLLTTALT